MIGFRVDANEYIASGHLMRCMAIALECVRKGQECLFLLAEDKLTERLKANKLPYRILNSAWNDLESEKELMAQLIADEKLDWLIVDSYQATKEYLEYLNRFTRVFYVDDMAEDKYDVAALLHYSQWPDDDSYMKMYENSRTKLLAGMKYAPLRSEFNCASDNVKRENSILFTTGGTDTYNVTAKFLRQLNRYPEFEQMTIHVIVGNMNSNEDELRQLANGDSRIVLHKNINNMSDYMKKCCCAVSAGGTTLYELCACKIPTVCFSFADNQVDFTKEMGSRGIMLYAGDARTQEDIAESISNCLIKFLTEPQLREEYANSMKNLVDGNGTGRIVEFLCGK